METNIRKSIDYEKIDKSRDRINSIEYKPTPEQVAEKFKAILVLDSNKIKGLNNGRLSSSQAKILWILKISLIILLKVRNRINVY